MGSQPLAPLLSSNFHLHHPVRQKKKTVCLLYLILVVLVNLTSAQRTKEKAEEAIVEKEDDVHKHEKREAEADPPGIDCTRSNCNLLNNGIINNFNGNIGLGPRSFGNSNSGPRRFGNNKFRT